MRMLPELRLLVAKLLSLVANSFSTVVLSPFFTSSERASGNAVATSFIWSHDGVRFVAADQRHFRAEPEDLADAAGVEGQVLIQRDAPACAAASTSDCDFVDVVAAHLERRVQHEQGLAAVLHVRLDGVHFRLHVFVLRARHDQHRAVLGHFDLAGGRRGSRRSAGRGGLRAGPSRFSERVL